MQASFIKSATESRDFPPDVGAEVAFVGRSNSGKSSSINRITAQAKLARVSKTPGRTQLINFFDLGQERRLVDLPGYGFARVPDRVRQQWRGMIEGYFTARRSLRGLFLTADIRRGIKDQDLAMIAYAAEIGCPVVVLVTKADKLSKGAGARHCFEAERTLGSGIEVIRFSALSGIGVETARERLLGWLNGA